jgi:hypothetical protein
MGPSPHGNRPSSLPRCTAWVRRAAPSLSKARAQWVFLLARRIGSEGSDGRRFRGNKHFPHHHRFPDRFPDCFAAARDAQAEPDAEGREQDGDQRAVELDRVLDNDETVFGVLEGGDQEAANDTEDEDVALHDGIVRKYTRSTRSSLQQPAFCDYEHPDPAQQDGGRSAGF